jgi:glycerophosphoryl diester phosphodiesterase
MPLRFWFVACALSATLGSTLMSRPLVIAHRGSSGYLPEHTLAAAAHAHALGSDFIEQDVVASRDGVLVVLHDIHVDTVTDVAERFPQRARADGRFYAIDFDWQELRSLNVRERFDPATGAPVYPRRFPANGAPFRLCTLEEQILLIQGLNATTGREVGIYVEFKAPAWHAAHGFDLGAALLATLDRHGYREATDRAFVQCFDATALRRLREELGTRLRLVQLIGENAWGESDTDYDALRTPEGLRTVAQYAQGIGPHLGQIIPGRSADGNPQLTSLLRDARAAGLFVHAYTFRADALPPAIDSPEDLVRLFVAAGVDGLFIDHPDLGRRIVDRFRGP